MNNIQLWFSVAEQACFFGLLGLGYLLILQGAGFFNFAIGPYAMVGGLSASTFAMAFQIPPWIAVVMAIALVAMLAAATEVLVVRPIQARDGGADLPALVAVAALLFGISQAAGLIFGRQQRPGLPLLTFPPFPFLGGFISPSMVLIGAVAILSFAGVSVWVRVSPTGRALRAVGDNRHAAQLLGLPVNRVRIAAFAVSGVICAAAGIAFATKAGVSWDRGLSWALLGFLSLVIGGTASWWAPLLGGAVLAALYVFVPYYLGGQYADYVILGIALIMFAFRPQGLLVRRVRV